MISSSNVFTSFFCGRTRGIKLAPPLATPTHGEVFSDVLNPNLSTRNILRGILQLNNRLPYLTGRGRDRDRERQRQRQRQRETETERVSKRQGEREREREVKKMLKKV